MPVLARSACHFRVAFHSLLQRECLQISHSLMCQSRRALSTAAWTRYQHRHLHHVNTTVQSRPGQLRKLRRDCNIVFRLEYNLLTCELMKHCVNTHPQYSLPVTCEGALYSIAYTVKVNRGIAYSSIL